MTSRIQFLTATFVALGFCHAMAMGDEKTAFTVSFPEASVHFEQNATDGDVEVVFAVKAGDEGLSKLVVNAPDGRCVVDFTAPDASTLGIRQFHFESPEPGDVARLKSAYPEGAYTFSGETAVGQRFDGKSALSHKLPATVSFLRPKADEQQVRVEDLEITWTTVENVAGYIVEIEQDELEVNITAKLPASAARFDVPDGFLLPGTEYQLGIATVSQEGNISFVETSFTTARRN